MIETSTTSIAVQMKPSSGVVWHIRVESWYAGTLLADDIPVDSGTEISDRTSAVPERLTLTVPREVDGVDWSPEGDPLHPLAPNGQRLRVILGAEVRRDYIEWTQRGEYLITSAKPEGDQVRIEALGLLALVEEARLVSPYQPSGTLKSTIRGLVEPALTVVFDSALTDRSVPAGINFDEDRLGGVQEVLTAWPAEMRMSGRGYLYVRPVMEPISANSVLSFTDNFIELNGDADREDAVNCVVARGTASDGGQIQGVAYVNYGPHRYGGPFNVLPVPEFFASPLLTTVAQCRLAAQTRLNKRARQYRQPWRMSAPPLTFLQHGDVVMAGPFGGDLMPCTIEALTLPLMPGQGQEMELVLAGDPDAV